MPKPARNWQPHRPFSTARLPTSHASASQSRQSPRRVPSCKRAPGDDHPLPLLVAALPPLHPRRRAAHPEVLQVLRVRVRRPARHVGRLRVDRQWPLPRERGAQDLHQREGGRPLGGCARASRPLDSRDHPMSEKGQAMRIWKFEGADLDALRYALLRDDDDVPTYCIRFADDGGGLKVKVNEDMWSLDYGTLEVSR